MFRIIRHIYDVVAAVLLVCCIICIIIQVFSRYVLSVSVPWTEEMARFFLIAVTFLGSGCASARGEHLGAFFLRDRVRGRAKGVMLVLSSLVCLAFETAIMFGCYKMFQITAHIEAVTVPQVKFNWLYVIMALGAAMMFLCSAIDLVRSIGVVISGDTDDLPTGVSSPFLSQE